MIYVDESHREQQHIDSLDNSYIDGGGGSSPHRLNGGSSNSSAASRATRGAGGGVGGPSRPDSQRSRTRPISQQMSRYGGKVGLNQG